MRQLSHDGHVAFCRVNVHPDGTPYLLFAHVERSPRRIVLVRRKPDGGFDLVWELRQGTPPFSSHPGDGDFAFLPDGSVYVAIPFSVPTMSDRTALFETTLPQAAPPFTAAARYTYTCSATDVVARQQAEAVRQIAERAELAATQARARVREDGDQNEATLRGIGAELRNQLASLQKAWRDEMWAKLIPDRIYALLNDPAAPLPNIIAQRAIAAVQSELKRLGLLQ